MKKLTRLAITCGGTGGHFYPGLSVARRLRRQGGEVLLVLSGIHSLRQKEIAESYGVAAVALPHMPRPAGPKTLLAFTLGLTRGYFGARRALREFRPQALLGMGSFASLPAVMVAYRCRIPLFLHDGNARVGKANRMFSQHARLLGTAFPVCNRKQCKCLTEVTGMPLRPELEEAAAICRANLASETATRSVGKADARTEAGCPAGAGDREAAIAELNALSGAGLDPALPLLLIVGGSQGADIFNRTLPEALRRFPAESFQVAHLTGPGREEPVVAAYREAAFRALVLPASERMDLLLRAADLVFARSGGSTVAELALFGKAAVLIPYPHAAENHQEENARFLVKNGAADLLHNRDCTVENLAARVRDFLANPAAWRQRALAAARLGTPGAAETLLRLIAERL